jgi:predicted Zn-dependent protease
MSKTATRVWLGLGGLVGGLLIGVGVLWFRSWYAPGGEKSLKAAQAAYEEGRQSLDQERYEPAVLKLDEAQLLASKAMEELDQRGQRAQAAHNEAEIQKVVPLQGEALWVKAQALRDKFFASQGAAGQPIPLTLDTSNGKHFRNLRRVTDDAARNEAFRCQREAARRLPQREDILLDTLRTEVSQNTPDWGLLETLARGTLDLSPKDPRALYLVARIDVEQPRSDGKGPATPSPEAKRSRDRLLKARDTLASAGADKIPTFRKMYLEAQIARLLRDQYVKARKTKDAEKEDQALVKLVVDPRTSELAVALGGADFKGLSKWDFEGIIGLHILALERVVEDLTGTAADPAPALGVLDRLLSFGRTQAGEGGNREALEKTTLAVVEGASRVQLYYESRLDPDWRKALDGIQALARDAQEHKAGTPALYSALSQLLGREAVLEGKRGNKERQDALKSDASKWLDEGLKSSLGDKAGSRRFELLALAAERAALDGKREEANKYLADLRKIPGSTVAATVALIEALLLEREGKLDRARQELESVLVAPVPALHLRAHLLLAQLYRILNQPEKALGSLLYIERIVTGFAALPEVERAWAQQFHANPESVTVQLILAHLGTARAKLARYLQANGGKQDGAASVLQPHEEAVERLLTKLPKKSELERIARQEWVAYRAQTGRVEAARKDLAALRADFPASAELLRIEIAVLLLPAPGTQPSAMIDPKTRDAADRLLDQFITANPTVEAGRLLRAQWLLRTERAAQAVTELQDKKNFPTASPAQQQVLALALMSSGQKKEGLTVLQHLPESANLDALLIQLAESRDEKSSRLDAALKRYERNGLFLCWDGERRRMDGKPAEAVARFREAIEITSVRPLAEQGLRRALFDMAQKEPRAARDLSVKLAEELPQEPLPLLAAAYAMLILGDLGSPADTWPKAKTMSAALNAWEARMNSAGGDKVAAVLTRSEFYGQANNVAQARSEVERALVLDPKQPNALLRGISLALSQPTPDALDRAEQYLKVLATAQPDSRATLLATAGLAEAGGRLDDAITAYEKVLDKDAADVTANQKLIAVLDRKKATDKIPARLDAWSKATPDAVTPKLLRVCYLAKAGQPAAAVDAGRKLVEEQAEAAEKKAAGTGKTVRQEMRMEVGRQLVAGGAFDASEAWISDLLADAPDLVGAQLLRGDWLLLRKRNADACELYRKMLDKDPNNYIAANNLAYLLAVEMNKPAEADAVVRATRRNKFTGQIIPGDRLDPAFLDTIGLVYQKLNQPERLAEMRELFETAFTRYPDDPRLGWHLGFALAGLKEEAQARETLDRAAKLADAGSGRLTPEERVAVRQSIEQLRQSLR